MRTRMGTVTIKIPLVTWRDGRPRWFVSPLHRRLGFKSEDLRHGAGGAWFTVEECQAWSAAKLEEIAAVKAAAGNAPKMRVRRRRPGSRGDFVTLSQVVTDFIDKDPRNQGREVVEGRKRRKPRAGHTVRFYRTCAAAVEDVEADHLWNAPLSAATPAALSGLLDRVEIARGLSMARGVRAMLSQAFAWAVAQKLIAGNPMRLVEDRLPVPVERVRVGTVAEMLALAAAGDELGRPEIGDAIWLGLTSAQRQDDRLGLDERQLTADGVLWHQSKTGERLVIPLAKIAATRLQAARERRRDWKVVQTRLIVDERAQRPFKADWYRKVFREVRDHAAKTMPSLADFRDQDLRDTALSWADYAGCDDAEIGNLSGHRFARETRILRHYVSKFDPAKAKSAIAKLEAWLDRQMQHEKGKAL